jgi:hypothetical protein
MTGAQNKRSLRKGIWDRDKVSSTDVGEAMRDIDTRVRNMQSIDVRVYQSQVWSVPFDIDTHGLTPAAIIVGLFREPGGQIPVTLNDTPNWVMFNNQVRISTIAGAVVGTRYDMTFLIFYAAG